MWRKNLQVVLQLPELKGLRPWAKQKPIQDINPPPTDWYTKQKFKNHHMKCEMLTNQHVKKSSVAWSAHKIGYVEGGLEKHGSCTHIPKHVHFYRHVFLTFCALFCPKSWTIKLTATLVTLPLHSYFMRSTSPCPSFAPICWINLLFISFCCWPALCATHWGHGHD